MNDFSKQGLLIIDLQNDFLHPEGAYGRAGLQNSSIAALPKAISPVVRKFQKNGGWIISAQFTLIAGKKGIPFISKHLKDLRPFLGKGDFASGKWGHNLVDELQPADLIIEKVAYSAFYMTRLEWILRKAEIKQLFVCGIVTNGGVASTIRDAHLRDFQTTLISDGCAAFSTDSHSTALADLSTIVNLMTCEEVLRI
tara:strand:+ start:191 stop:781 length:591 start_codon:yes stop_codon:yes gene_type:complete